MDIYYSNQANASAHSSIQNIIDNGTQVLYDKYINQKIPLKIHQQQQQLINSNINVSFMEQPTKHIFFSLSNQVAQKSNKDYLTPFSVTTQHEKAKKQATKYQNYDKNGKIDKKLNNKFVMSSKKASTREQMQIIPQQIFQKTVVNPQRPYSMISQRKESSNQKTNTSKIDVAVEKRRASTSMNNRKKIFNQKQYIRQNLINLIKEQDLKSLEQQHAKLKNYKLQNSARSLDIQSKKKAFQESRRLKQKRTRQNYQKLRSKLLSNRKYELLNFQSVDGQININNSIAQAQNQNIVQINFKKYPQLLYSTVQSQKISVSKFRNRFIRCQEGRNKKFVSNIDYNNNDGRQISSIPYVNLCQGIMIRQPGGITISAIRRKPKDQISKSQYDAMQISSFKSFDQTYHLTRKPQHLNDTQNSNQSQLNRSNVTKKTNKSIEESSLLWNPRKLSQNKYIKVSNSRYLNEQIMDN